MRDSTGRMCRSGMSFLWAMMKRSHAAMQFGSPNLSVCRSLVTAVSKVMWTLSADQVSE